MNVLLHGHDSTPGYVGAHPLNDSHIRLYQRLNGNISHRDAEVFPFFFLSDATLLNSFERKHWLKDLEGSNYYRVLAVFERWTDIWDAVRIVLENHRRRTGERIDGYENAPFLYFRPDPVAQYLMQTGITLFKGLDFTDLRRMQISLATQVSRGIASDPRRSEDRILAIALSDSTGWSEVIEGRRLEEPALLQRFVQCIEERDPDVLEGYNLFGRDLPYLLQRFSFHELPCPIGRSGNEPRLLQTRWTGQDAEQDSGLYEIPGRHAVDVLILAHAYDFSRRALESLDLHTLAAHFGAPIPRRSFTDAGISALWQEEPREAVDALQHASRAIDAISLHLSPSSFYLTQMVPLPYSAVARTGSAVKIESLMTREYLRRKHSLPRPERGTQTTGGYADLYMTGVFENVILADVESLYPSIILERNIRPASDTLGIFPELLKDLVTLRLDAKKNMRSAEKDTIRLRYDAMQSSFKILINSFYGYLGYSRGLFNDYAKADEITKTGQELLRRIVRQVELHNGVVVEVDTDGVFFIPPDNVSTEEDVESLVGRISQSLPSGINLVSSGRFRKMMSYKKKNYALLDSNGSVIIKGSSLISRSMERFLRRFVRLAIANLLDGNFNGLHQLFSSMESDLVSHRWEVADFCRTETVHDTFAEYDRGLAEGRRNPSALYEVVRRAGRQVKPGDKIAYYVTGTTAGVRISENCKLAEEWDPNFPDENTAYYRARLAEITERFAPFFSPEDFRKIFTSEDLFGFDATGIRILQQRVGSEGDAPSPMDEQERTEFRIWLGEG